MQLTSTEELRVQIEQTELKQLSYKTSTTLWTAHWGWKYTVVTMEKLVFPPIQYAGTPADPQLPH